MPRPPILPVLDWKAISESGRPFEAWLALRETPANCDAMQAQLETVSLPAPVLAYLAALPRDVHVVAIAEDWCGDVVRHVPYLEALAQAAPRIETRYVSREQYPEVFARYLTNGGEAIPKFVFLSAEWIECGNWGPMPEDCKQLIARGKACGNVGRAREKVSARYAADPEGNEVIDGLMALVATAVCTAP